MIDVEKFALPCIGCGTEAGESRVVIRIDSHVYFTNPLTAKMLATDLMLWAEHVEKLNEEQAEYEETQEQPERGNAELLESIIKGCKELNIQMETMFPHDADQTSTPITGAVAWGVFEDDNLHDVEFTEERAVKLAGYKGDHAVVKPLFAAKQTPMPEEEALKLILGERSSLLELVRQVEQYHGIGTEPKEDQCD
jgi:hypothetical protein